MQPFHPKAGNSRPSMSRSSTITDTLTSTSDDSAFNASRNLPDKKVDYASSFSLRSNNSSASAASTRPNSPAYLNQQQAIPNSVSLIDPTSPRSSTGQLSEGELIDWSGSEGGHWTELGDEEEEEAWTSPSRSHPLQNPFLHA